MVSTPKNLSINQTRFYIIFWVSSFKWGEDFPHDMEAWITYVCIRMCLCVCTNHVVVRGQQRAPSSARLPYLYFWYRVSLRSPGCPGTVTAWSKSACLCWSQGHSPPLLTTPFFFFKTEFLTEPRAHCFSQAGEPTSPRNYFHLPRHGYAPPKLTFLWWQESELRPSRCLLSSHRHQTFRLVSFPFSFST